MVGTRPSLKVRAKRAVARVTRSLRQGRAPLAPRLPAPVSDRAVVLDAPIFVVGCFRSGTSLLRRILDSHPSIACPPESKFIVHLAQTLRDPSSLRGLDSMGFGRDEVAGTLGAAAASFFSSYAAAQGKTRWADKTPDYVEILPELWELFGAKHVRFLLLFRHGMDVAHSLSNPNRNFPAIQPFTEAAGGSVPVGAARFWVDQNEKIRAFQQLHGEACFALTYEAVTSDPAGSLRPLFEFLGEPWDPRVMDYDNAPHHRGIEDPDIRRKRSIESNSGNYRAWPRDTQRQVREACGSMLTLLGYS
jgi:protein-tyrosine sulfotransferase